MAKYEEQLDRIQRWFFRIQPLMEECMTPFDRDAETYADDFHAFFVECHSMKEWLINDPEFAHRKEEVKAYVKKTPSLRLCADLANGKKHLVLKDEWRWSQDASVDGLAFAFVVLEGDVSCSTGRDAVGAKQANKTKQKWLDCGIAQEDITISVFCDAIIDGSPCGHQFDGAIDLAWDAFDAWRRFVEPKTESDIQSGAESAQTEKVENGRRAEGTIKKLMDRGFGFIKVGEKRDLFFHKSSLQGVPFEELCVGQKVSYTEGRGPKGPRAENVKLL